MLDIYFSVGAVAGIAVPVAYRLSFEAFNNVYRANPIFPVLTYAAIPMSSLGFIAFATAEILG
ncbi:hypothetical protein RQN30_09185 [Arcanobacterium hippocoleae]